MVFQDGKIFVNNVQIFEKAQLCVGNYLRVWKFNLLFAVSEVIVYISRLL